MCKRTFQKQKDFDKLAQAYEQVQENGYGIVMPTIEELSLEEPEIIKQSGKYGIRLKASAPSIHMMKIYTKTEVTPIVGSEQQSEELVSYLLKEFEENPEKFGKVISSANPCMNLSTRDCTINCIECRPTQEQK